MENQTTQWKPETIIVEPSRLQSGIWGQEEGDISQSYSADVYSEKKTIRKPFTHASHLYVTMSIHGSYKFLQAHAYPLIHESYCESLLKELSQTEKASSYYTGKPVSYRRQKCVFGLPVIFKQRVYTTEEHIDLLRRMYAYGGLFAAEADSYVNFLSNQKDKEDSEHHIIAIINELAYASQHQLATQEDVREWIQIPRNNLASIEQLSLL